AFDVGFLRHALLVDLSFQKLVEGEFFDRLAVAMLVETDDVVLVRRIQKMAFANVDDCGSVTGTAEGFDRLHGHGSCDHCRIGHGERRTNDPRWHASLDTTRGGGWLIADPYRGAADVFDLPRRWFRRHVIAHGEY